MSVVKTCVAVIAALAGLGLLMWALIGPDVEGIPTRVRPYGESAFLVFPKYRSNTYSLARQVGDTLVPYPSRQAHEKGLITNAVDIHLDSRGTLWVLDSGVVRTLGKPLRKSGPRVLALDADTGEDLVTKNKMEEERMRKKNIMRIEKKRIYKENVMKKMTEDSEKKELQDLKVLMKAKKEKGMELKKKMRKMNMEMHHKVKMMENIKKNIDHQLKMVNQDMIRKLNTIKQMKNDLKRSMKMMKYKKKDVNRKIRMLKKIKKNLNRKIKLLNMVQKNMIKKLNKTHENVINLKLNMKKVRDNAVLNWKKIVDLNQMILKMEKKNSNATRRSLWMNKINEIKKRKIAEKLKESNWW